VPAGERVPEQVTLADLPATILDLLTLEEVSPFPGVSLARYWSDDYNPNNMTATLLSEVSQGINMEPWLPVMKGDMTSLVAEGLHYIKNGDGREELYDFENDPDEERDLATSDEGRRLLAQFRMSLDLILSGRRSLK